MLLLGVDVETTGLSVTEDLVIEIGAVLWHSDRKVPLEILSTLVKVDVELRPEITKLTGIRTTDLVEYGIPPANALTALGCLMQRAEFIVAHNGSTFDRPMLENEFRRHNVMMPESKWIDTSVDVEYPEGIKTRKLVHLAAEHGFLNPFAHRAIFDVLTMLTVLASYDNEEVAYNSQMPSYTLVADTTAPWKDSAPEGKKQTDLAKQRGYRWDGDKKQWTKLVKERQLAQELSHGEFPVRKLT